MPISKSTLYSAVKQTIVEYLKQTYLNGFGLLYYVRRRKYQRVVWSVVLGFNIIFGFYTIALTLIYFQSNPMYTVLLPDELNVREVPFPVVAICSANQLSRRAVHAYAHELAALAPDRAFNYWLKKLDLLSGFFDPDSVTIEEATDFHNELNLLLSKRKHTFNSSAVLHRLTPKCEDQLLGCWLGGESLNCSDLFKLSATGVGFCCIFDGERYLIENDFPQSLRNQELGLKLLLNTSMDDYFYNSETTNAYTMMLFDTGITPDEGIGDIQQLRLSGAAIIEMQVEARLASPAVRSYPADKRQCYFVDELQNDDYDKKYSQSECIYRCRIQSTINNCNCFPYHAPWEAAIRNPQITYCSLAEIDCMQRYKFKWQTFTLQKSEPPEPETSSMQETLYCGHCQPLCTYYRYNYRKTALNMRNLQAVRVFRDNLNNKMPKAEKDKLGAVLMYFRTQYAKKYQIDVKFNWYQILSNVGGIMSINIGCSIISGIEIIYFILYRLSTNWKNMRKTFVKK